MDWMHQHTASPRVDAHINLLVEVEIRAMALEFDCAPLGSI
jgi:hypothetical protein